MPLILVSQSHPDMLNQTCRMKPAKNHKIGCKRVNKNNLYQRGENFGFGHVAYSNQETTLPKAIGERHHWGQLGSANEINLIRILGVHGHVHPILFIFTLYKLGFRIEALALTGYQMYTRNFDLWLSLEGNPIPRTSGPSAKSWNQLVRRPKSGSSGGGQVLVIPCSTSTSTFSLFFAENLMLSDESAGKAGPPSGPKRSHLAPTSLS